MIEKAPLQFYYYGYEKCDPGHSFGPAVRVHYVLHFIVNGKGVLHAGEQIYTVCKNQMFLIRPQEVCFYEADNEQPWEYLWFAFDGKEADRLIKLFFLNEDTYVKTAGETEKLEIFLKTALMRFQGSLCSQTELNGWCYLFFSCFKQKMEKEVQSSEKRYLSAALTYIRYNYMYDINIDQISMYLGIDRTYLYKIVKKYTAYSPKVYLTLCRIEAAKDMLRYSEYAITEIAFACGFHDSSGFCKVFRSYEKQTPSQYRRRCEK